MAWLELSIDARDEAVDWVCTLLAANGYDGEVRVAEAPAAERDARRPYRVTFYLPDDAPGNARARKLAEALESVTRSGMAGELEVETVPELPARAAAPPRPIGTRFVLLGSEDAGEQGSVGDLERPEPGSSRRYGARAAAAPQSLNGRFLIRLASGLAFGSGLHPATLATLRLVERHARLGQRALDLGSGSGILTVALARLGAEVLAVDNDPVAVEATRAAVRLNGLADQVEVAHASLGRGATFGHWLGWTELADAPPVDPVLRFDLLVANVLARLHAELAADYAAALAPAGLLITAGYTHDAEPDVARALADVGLEPVDRARSGEYVALAHRQPGLVPTT